MLPSSSLAGWRHVSRSLATRRWISTDAPNRFTILFMGRDKFSCRVLERLYAADDVWEELIIATQPDVYVGRRGSVLSVSPLGLMGQQLGIPVHTIPKEKKEFKHWLLPAPFELSPDSPVPGNHLLVTASFGRILTEKMLKQFPASGRLNVHPSLLPAYRGPAPIQHAILNQEAETGVCVIQMLKKSEGIDAGRIWGCRKLPMPDEPTFLALRDGLGGQGGDLLVSVLRDMMEGKATSQPQLSGEAAGYPNGAPKAPFITSEDSCVDFTSMTSEDIYTRFRALSHQKALFTYTPNGKTLQLTEMKSMTSWPDDLIYHLPKVPGQATYSKMLRMIMVRCARDTVLGVSMVKPESKKDMAAGAFWLGVRAPLVDGIKYLTLGLASVESKL